MTPAQAVAFMLGRSVSGDEHIADLVETIIECKRRIDESPRVREAMAAAVLALITNHDHPEPIKGMTYRHVQRVTGVPKSTLKDLADVARKARAASDAAAMNAAEGD